MSERPEQPKPESQPKAEKKPGFISRIVSRLDESMKRKAEEKQQDPCCGEDKKSGKCC